MKGGRFLYNTGDKMNAPLVISCTSHPELVRGICRTLDFPFLQVVTAKFANGNKQVGIPVSVRERDVFIVQTQVEPVDFHLMELLLAIDALRSSSAARITAVIPSFFYARGDKKDKPRISIAARLVAELLETAGANRVLVMDLHSPQIEGFFRTVVVDKLKGLPVLAGYLREHHLRDKSKDDYIVMAGDVGEAKDAGGFARLLDLDLAVIDKRRTGDDDRAQAVNLIGDVRGKHVIIVDDEIATAGTIMEGTAFAKKHGAKDFIVAATHGVLCGPAIERINSNPDIREMVVTDTIPQAERQQQCKKLTVLPVGTLFGQAINRIHIGRPVSELLE